MYINILPRESCDFGAGFLRERERCFLAEGAARVKSISVRRGEKGADLISVCDG